MKRANLESDRINSTKVESPQKIQRRVGSSSELLLGFKSPLICKLFDREKSHGAP
jgi:hypothetical protein